MAGRKHKDIAAQMVKDGLRRAQMEGGACRNYHSTYLRSAGFAFCPWCAEELVVRRRCEHCGKHFLSEDAYLVHLKFLEFYQANRCPQQRRSAHAVKYQKNRGTFWCSTCKIEYAPQAQDGKEEPIVDTRSRKTNAA